MVNENDDTNAIDKVAVYIYIYIYIYICVCECVCVNIICCAYVIVVSWLYPICHANYPLCPAY